MHSITLSVQNRIIGTPAPSPSPPPPTHTCIHCPLLFLSIHMIYVHVGQHQVAMVFIVVINRQAVVIIVMVEHTPVIIDEHAQSIATV